MQLRLTGNLCDELGNHPSTDHPPAIYKYSENVMISEGGWSLELIEAYIESSAKDSLGLANPNRYIFWIPLSSKHFAIFSEIIIFI